MLNKMMNPEKKSDVEIWFCLDCEMQIEVTKGEDTAVICPKCNSANCKKISRKNEGRIVTK